MKSCDREETPLGVEPEGTPSHTTQASFGRDGRGCGGTLQGSSSNSLEH